ncbi:MAG: cysteine desulfurase family protein, partial [Burkholderiales bacterium]
MLFRRAMQRSSYLDYNATTPVRPAAADAVSAALAEIGNPSSVHGFGRAARARLETAREQVAALIGARPDQVVFTSGGTEANNLAIRGSPRSRVLVSAIEHDSVRKASAAESITVEQSGVVGLAALERMLAALPEPALVAIMLANNETGVIQPAAEAARIAHAHGALLHCDAIQAAGKIAVDFAALGADMMSISAHKLGGPPGVGALIVADPTELAARQSGGGQERGRRAGTENLPGVVGFGVAAVVAAATMAAMARIAGLRDDLEQRAMAALPATLIFGREAPRLPNTSCLALPGLTSEVQVMGLDLAGVAVSAGSACSSGKVQPSHVLQAMGVDAATAGCAIRVSLGWQSTAADVDHFIAAWSDLAARAR